MGTGIQNDVKEIRMLKSWSEVDDAMQVMAEIDVETAGAQVKYNQALVDAGVNFREATGGKIDRRNQLAADVEKFCVKHRDEIVAGGTKSQVRPFGTIGFKDGPPKLEPVEGQNWDTVLEMVQKKIKDASERGLIETVTNLVKNALKKLDEKTLAKVGCQITQDETFVLTPNQGKAQKAA